MSGLTDVDMKFQALDEARYLPLKKVGKDITIHNTRKATNLGSLSKSEMIAFIKLSRG